MYLNEKSILSTAFVIAVVLIESSVAIKCWDCDSYTDRNCGDPFDNRTLSVTDCSQIADHNQQKCRKITQKVNGGVKYTRGCLIDDHASQQLQEATINLCSTDGCNSAKNHVPFILMIFATPVLVGILNIVFTKSHRK